MGVDARGSRLTRPGIASPPMSSVVLRSRNRMSAREFVVGAGCLTGAEVGVGPAFDNAGVETSGGGVMATVVLRSPLRDLAGGRSSVEVDGGSVGEVLGRLEGEYPRLVGWVRDEQGGIREHV